MAYADYYAGCFAFPIPRRIPRFLQFFTNLPPLHLLFPDNTQTPYGDEIGALSFIVKLNAEDGFMNQESGGRAEEKVEG